LLEVLDNVEKVLAIEALTAAQALDYRKPLSPGRGVQAAHTCLREVVNHKEADAYFGDDIARLHRNAGASRQLDIVAKIGVGFFVVSRLTQTRMGGFAHRDRARGACDSRVLVRPSAPR